MADLKPLIRLHQFTVDEKQKAVAVLYREAEKIEERKALLQKQIEDERVLAESQNDYEMIQAYGLFVDNARVKIDHLNEALAEINTRIEAAQDELREAFSEMKKVQIIQRNRELEERAERDQKESLAMDEVALQGFVRKQGDGQEDNT